MILKAQAEKTQITQVMASNYKPLINWETIFVNCVSDKEQTTQKPENRKPNQKMDKEPKLTFFKRRHTNGQLIHE